MKGYTGMKQSCALFTFLLMLKLLRPSNKIIPVAVIAETLLPDESGTHEVEGQNSVLIEIILQPEQSLNESQKLLEFKGWFFSFFSI